MSIVVWVRLTQATVVVSEPSPQILSPKGLDAKWYSTVFHQQRNSRPVGSTERWCSLNDKMNKEEDDCLLALANIVMKLVIPDGCHSDVEAHIDITKA